MPMQQSMICSAGVLERFCHSFISYETSQCARTGLESREDLVDKIRHESGLLDS